MRGIKNTPTGAFLAFILLLLTSCTAKGHSTTVLPGAWRTQAYFPRLAGKSVGVVANQTSTIGQTHLVDSLLHAGISVKRIFAPEHGFRGDAANGEEVKDGKDGKTGLPVSSLYGTKIKPSKNDLNGIDIMVFDIQDVGARFYTFLTTLHYVMEACAENHIPLLLLDRPNPNSFYIDGPILDTAFRSMVGMHPIPLVHGMTLGELARMINGEGWLKTKDTCKLEVIAIEGWDHNRRYDLPVAPSPNLPSRESIILYPTLGLFEGTVMSMGRGTDKPFECYGAPWLKSGSYKFVPKNIPGKAMNPPFLNDTCRGFLVSDFARNFLVDQKNIYIEWLEMLLTQCPNKQTFFNPFFDKLAGTSTLRMQLLQGKSANDIRKTWKPGLDAFSQKRKPYMLYAFDAEAGLKN